MMKLLLPLLLLFLSLSVKAQSDAGGETIFLRPNVFPAVIIGNDTIASVWLPQLVVFAPMRFNSVAEQSEYHRLVRDVRRTLPYAKRIAQIMIETYRYIETLPDDRARQQHLRAMDRHLRQEYGPRMRQLTRAQGQILMLLVDRETNSSSYQIIQATMGRAQAFAANALANLFGNSLRTRYDPFGEHRTIERIAIMVEQGAVW